MRNNDLVRQDMEFIEWEKPQESPTDFSQTDGAKTVIDGGQRGKEGGQQCIVFPHNRFLFFSRMQSYCTCAKVGADFVGILKKEENALAGIVLLFQNLCCPRRDGGYRNGVEKFSMWAIIAKCLFYTSASVPRRRPAPCTGIPSRNIGAVDWVGGGCRSGLALSTEIIYLTFR